MKTLVILLLSLSVMVPGIFEFVYAESDDFRFIELNDSYYLGDKITIKFEKITQQPCPSYEIIMMKAGFPESAINVGVEPLCAISGPVEPYLFFDDLERIEFFDSAGTYTIKVKLDNETIQKQIKVADNKTTLNESDGFFNINEKQVRYIIPYTISNGVINDMILYCEHGSLLVKITPQTKSGGMLVLDFPRSIIDPKTNDNDKDDRFFVLRDGVEIDYDEIPYPKYRKISLPFSADTQEIEIIQAFIPELKPEMCKTVHDPPYSYLLPPLKQVKNEIPLKEIQCRDSFMLISKHDDSPACVKPETKIQLVKRGWISETNNSDNHILQFSPVLFKGTGITLDGDNSFPLEEFQKLQQRKIELDMLLEDKSIPEKIQDELSDERNMIQYRSQQAFDEQVPFELVTILWEKTHPVQRIFVYPNKRGCISGSLYWGNFYWLSCILCGRKVCWKSYCTHNFNSRRVFYKIKPAKGR